MAFLALFVSVAGSAAALPGEDKVTSDDLVKNAVKTKDVADLSVGSDQLLGKPLPNERAPRQAGIQQSKAISSDEAASSLFGDSEDNLLGLHIASSGLDQTDIKELESFDEVAVGLPICPPPDLVRECHMSNGMPVVTMKHQPTQPSGTPVPFGQQRKINVSTADFQAGNFEVVGGNLCVRVPGIYRVFAAANWEQNEYGSRVLLLFRGDNVIASSVRDGIKGALTTQTVETLEALRRDDCLHLEVVQTSFVPNRPSAEWPPLRLLSGNGADPRISAAFQSPLAE